MFRVSAFEKCLGKFRNNFTSVVYKLDTFIDKATSHLLMEADWPSILQICDLIRQNDVQ